MCHHTDFAESCPASRPHNREVDSALAVGWGVGEVSSVLPADYGDWESIVSPQRGSGQKKTRPRQRIFVKRFALCCQTAVCLSVLFVCLSVCLSVTLLYCGQMVGWIKMKLGMQVGLGPGHDVLDEDPALPPPKGQIPQC